MSGGQASEALSTLLINVAHSETGGTDRAALPMRGGGERVGTNTPPQPGLSALHPQRPQEAEI